MSSNMQPSKGEEEVGRECAFRERERGERWMWTANEVDMTRPEVGGNWDEEDAEGYRQQRTDRTWAFYTTKRTTWLESNAICRSSLDAKLIISPSSSLYRTRNGELKSCLAPHSRIFFPTFSISS